MNISEALNNVTAPFDFISISSFISKYTGAKFGMGAEAVQQLLEEVNLDDELKSIQEELRNTTGSKNQKRQKLIKRLEVVQAFRHSQQTILDDFKCVACNSTRFTSNVTT